MTRIEELTAKLKAANEAYVNATPIMSDEEYDALSDELASLDALNASFKTVGAPPVSAWVKVKHDHPMGSLDKVNAPEELDAWVASRNMVGETLFVTEKLDGISVQLRYVGGLLRLATTRGDGFTGEDITQNVARMKGVPEVLPKKVSCVVRGEIILLKSDLAEHFAEYTNTRNTASGVAKRLDGVGCEHLTVMVYQATEGVKVETEEEAFQALAALGFQVPNRFVCGEGRTPQDLWLSYQAGRRDRLDYDIDGLVVRFNNLLKQTMLGDRDLRPLGAVAFKFAAASRATTSRKLIRQTGGTGRITPVVEMDPVTLVGAVVTRASLYNWKYIRDLGFDVGAEILVARANDVIPRVLKVIKATGTVAQPPETCDVCGGTVVQEGEFHVCSNHEQCPAQITGRIEQWIASLNILEWGQTILEKLVSSNLVRTVPDLYRLTVEQLASLDRMGVKSAENLVATLHAEKVLPLELLLGSLSIPGLATSSIKMAMDAGFDTFDKLSSATLVDLAKIPGFGPVKAATLFKWLASNQGLLASFAEVGVTVKERVQGRFTGSSFCFTGAMKNKRPDLEEMVLRLGGEVKNSVTKKLTYLVLADTSTTKAAAAKKYGTKLLTEDEFLAMVGA